MTNHDGATSSIAMNRLRILVVEELGTDRNVCPTRRRAPRKGGPEILVRATFSEFFNCAGHPGQH